VKTILDRKVTPMLPEPTLPKPATAQARTAAPTRTAAQARTQPGVMTPLFSVPGGSEPGAPPAPGRRVRQPGRTRRVNSRSPADHADHAGRTARGGGPAKSIPLKDPADLLAVTAERLRRALARSFLRYGIPGDLEAAVHAAMNVIDPVLEARDAEILRLRRLMAGKVPGQLSGR
jgi:hypothetical protein